MSYLFILFFILQCAFAVGDGSCPHTYTIQPPDDIVCNPYVNQTIQLECGVTGLDLQRIQWYFSALNSMNIFADDVIEIHNSTKYTLYENATSEGLSVVLKISNLTEESDMGTYWCRAFLLNGRMLIPANSFELKTSETYPPNKACRPQPVKSAVMTCARVFVFSSTATSSPSTTMEPTTTEDMGGYGLGRSEGYTTIGQSPSTMSSGSTEIPILYIIIGLIGFLTAICIMLAFVICLLCRRVQNKYADRVIEFGQIPNQPEFCSKRPDFSMLPMDSSLQSDGNKNGSGDYAEIGPELMSSVKFHSCKEAPSHYSEINDVMLQPYHTSESSNMVQEPDGKENPYDEPSSTTKPTQTELSPPVATVPPDTPLLCHNYSRLERMVPLIYVTNESNPTDNRMTAEGSPLAPNYHTLEPSTNGSAFLYSSAYSEMDQTDRNSYTGAKVLLPSSQQLPTILEHPYHVLEQSGPIFDTCYQDTELLYSYNLDDSASQSDRNDYDRLVDPQLYSLLEHSVPNSGLSKIYDVKHGPYSKLDPHATAQYRRKSKSVTELELSAEIFDDVQYVITPTPKSADIEIQLNLDSIMEDQVESKGGSGVSSKYNGDYERDPIYMERMKCDDVSDSASKSLSLPNIYQPLQVAAMDPIQDYENYMPRSFSSGNN